MKTIRLLLAAIVLAFFTSNFTQAQLSADIIDIHGDIPELSLELYPTDMIVFQGEMYIGMADDQGYYATMTELVKYDGTSATVVDLGQHQIGSYAHFCIHQGDLYFRLWSGQLGKYDGSTCTEINLSQMNPQEVDDPANPGHLCSYNGDLYFKVEGLSNEPARGDGEPLAKYDGQTVTVFDMSDFHGDLEWDCEPNSLVVYNGLLHLFTENCEYEPDGWCDNFGLIAWDGSSDAEFIGYAEHGYTVGHKAYLCVYQNDLYMRTEGDYFNGDYDGYSTLGRYDGVNGVENIDLNALNPEIHYDNYPGHMTVHNGELFFKASHNSEGERPPNVLASYNGSQLVFHNLNDLNPNISFDLSPAAMCSYNGKLYLRGQTSDRAWASLIGYNTSPAVIPIGNWGLLLGSILIALVIGIRLIRK